MYPDTAAWGAFFRSKYLISPIALSCTDENFIEIPPMGKKYAHALAIAGFWFFPGISLPVDLDRNGMLFMYNVQPLCSDQYDILS